MKDQNTPTNTLNPIVIELQRIFDQFNDGELIDQPLSQGEAIRRIESLISEEVNKARISELERLLKLHTRTLRQTITDKSGEIYSDDTHVCISKYETLERIAELKELETFNQIEGEK